MGDILNQYKAKGSFADNYRVQEQIGTGTYAQVFLCRHRSRRRFSWSAAGESDGPQAVAVKAVLGCHEDSHRGRPITEEVQVGDRSFVLQGSSMASVRNELEALAESSGVPGTCRMHKFFEVPLPNVSSLTGQSWSSSRLSTPTLFLIVMDYIPGGTLAEAVEERGSLTEEDAKDVARQMLIACDAMHRRGIIHRDIKPANIMLHHKHCFHDGVAITDMGFAICTKDRKVGLLGRCGTPEFVAPEVLRASSYGFKVDIWSCGATVSTLLTGFSPFSVSGDEVEGDDSATSVVLRKVLKAEVAFDMDPAWELVSDEAKDFVLKCLNPDPDSRPSALEALKHPWLSTSTAGGIVSHRGRRWQSL